MLTNGIVDGCAASRGKLIKEPTEELKKIWKKNGSLSDYQKEEGEKPLDEELNKKILSL